METKNNTPKPLPHAVTKAELVSMYLDQMAEQMIIKNINEIILDNRKKMPSYIGKTPRQIIASPKVYHDEFNEFVCVCGMPKGYFKPENSNLKNDKS